MVHHFIFTVCAHLKFSVTLDVEKAITETKELIGIGVEE